MSAFKDEVVVITGATGGLGQALAAELLARGPATLCLVGRNLEKLETLTRNVQPGKQRVSCYQADLTLDEDIKKLAENFERDYGRIDVLIHAAGVISLGAMEQTPVKDFDLQYRINVRAPYVLTQALLPLLRQRQGQIVFVNSSAGLDAKAGVSQYAATKHALKAIADSLREEVNREGIRVLNVFLGRTATPMQAAVHEMEGRPYQPGKMIQAQTVATVIINLLGLPRDAEVTGIHIRPAVKVL